MALAGGMTAASVGFTQSCTTKDHHQRLSLSCDLSERLSSLLKEIVKGKMSFDIAKLDDRIEKLRNGSTLTENEVKALCDQVNLRYVFRGAHALQVIPLDSSRNETAASLALPYTALIQ